MAVYSRDLRIKTKGEGCMVDLTKDVSVIVSESKITHGIVVVFCPGSTGAVSTVEYEPGLMKDIPKALERIAPSDAKYEHNKTWGCDNGRSHVKATLIGPSLTVPVVNGMLMLGTWQQIVFMELDTRPRERGILVQVLGE